MSPIEPRSSTLQMGLPAISGEEEWTKSLKQVTMAAQVDTCIQKPRRGTVHLVEKVVLETKDSLEAS